MSCDISKLFPKQPTLTSCMTALICRSSFADHSSKNPWRSVIIILRKQTRSQNISNITSWLVSIIRLIKAISDHKTSPFNYGVFYSQPISCSAYNHGYKNLAKQSSWRSILFCVHDHIHWSKTAAMFTQLLPSLLGRHSTNEWPPWYHNLPRM